MKVDFKGIEIKWQKKWEDAKIFEANVDDKKTKFFITVPYPYVNGGPHVGAGFTFGRGDIYARFKRMQGFNVLFPQGFHATGEPIVGVIKRLREDDEDQIDALKIYGVDNEQIEEFKQKGPEFFARFWMNWWIEDLKRFGYSCDWRRTFITALTPQYNRFIEWQYNILRRKGYVVQGTHPVIWCPKCQSPTGDHDRLKGEGESPIEYVILKFRLENSEKIIPCGTLRPETIFGATNIWIDPDVEYYWCKVNDETWLLSERAIEKLKDQLYKITTLQKIVGEELIGKFVESPYTGKIPILPAKFVDPEFSTGVVMSVPSHAPYDWIGLKELKENIELMKKYGIEEAVKKIEPISIIKVEGFGEHPAIEICQKMGIKSSREVKKLDKATSEIYRKEYHLGILKENCGEYKNKKISEVKDELVKNFTEKNIATKMWEVTDEVVCRCTTKCHVKILENQWFLKFSDEDWKDLVRECMEKMKFYPEEVRQQFLNTVEWLKNKACARKSGLGTRLPWDKEWIVETLSDSVIYMAFYTIQRIIEENKISAEKLTDEVFDYIFMGKGNLSEVSKSSGLDEKIIESMRKEFEYFYPVDLRTSGKDLVQNHLTFYVFHHVAIWNKKYWPKAIAINGFVNVEGKKMSKRFGNIIALRDLLSNYGADLVRINLLTSNEGLDDADWREENIKSFTSRLEYIAGIIDSLNRAKREKVDNIDKFLLAKLQKIVRDVTQFYEELKFRSVVQTAFFPFFNDLKWYVERNDGIENCNRKVLEKIFNLWIRIMAPIIPHFCEEFWEKLGNKNFVSISEWPKIEERVDEEMIRLEEIFRETLEDLSTLIELTKKRENVYFYLATEKEFEYFAESLDFIKRKFGFKKVEVFKASDPKRYDPENKAAKAKYGKPGIYLE
jgi:leucyl-tRNA synthetase